MPDLNLNYAPTPPWLEKNPDNSAFSNLLAATQSGQRDRQLGMQEKELASRLVSAQQDQQLNELKIAEHLRLRDETLEAELAVQARAPVIAGLMREGKTEEALQEWMALGVENAKVRAVKSYATISDDLRFAFQVQDMAQLRKSQALENEAQARALTEGVMPEIRQVTDPTTGKPVSLIRTGPNSWREARGGGNIDPGEAARIQLSIENLIARRRAGQLDEKKFQLSILEKIQEIETAPLLGIKPADQPVERARRKAELLRQMRAMGITTEFTEPEGLRQNIGGQLTPPATTPGPTAPPTIWVPDFKSGRLVPKE